MAEVSSAIFREDRGWMYTGRRRRDSITPEWAEKTTEFVERAFRRVLPEYAALGVLCPCARCGNTRPQSKYDMQMHLCKNGFRPGYTVWVYHGESHSRRPADDQPEENGDLDGKEDAEFVDCGVEQEEVSSKPQGATKREISLIQAYAYSKLRKEDQIEWDYQKYLWENKKLHNPPNSSAQLETQLKIYKIHQGQLRLSEIQRDMYEIKEADERLRVWQQQYQEYYNSFMTAMNTSRQDGTPMLPMPPPPQMPPLPPKAPMPPSPCASCNSESDASNNPRWLFYSRLAEANLYLPS